MKRVIASACAEEPLALSTFFPPQASESRAAWLEVLGVGAQPVSTVRTTMDATAARIRLGPTADHSKGSGR